jgi:cell division septal protein FtsQ
MAKRIVRKKVKKIIPWRPILGGLLAANVVIACQFSKITAIRHVSLHGVRNTERERIQVMLGEIQGIPALQLKPRKIERRFTGQSRVLSADFRRNVFGFASLTLEYRKPVAILSDQEGVFLDVKGNVFGDPEIKPKVPKLKLDRAMRVTVVAMVGVINFAEIAELAALVQKELVGANDPADSIEIEVADTGGVSLLMRGGRVMLGTCNDLDKKIASLKGLLRENSNVLNGGSELNLMAPDKPSLKSKRVETP